jgi:lysophospholipase L1-like esterase
MKKRKIFYVQQFDTVHCCAGGQIEFPDSALTGLEVWHSLSDQVVADGVQITNISDLSGNGITGTASGTGRTMKIESGLSNLKGILMNGTDDKITFNLNGTIRTVAVLYKFTGATSFHWNDGLLTQQDLSAPNFVIGHDGGELNYDCQLYFNGCSCTVIDVDETSDADFATCSTQHTLSPNNYYHLVILELSAGLAWATGLQWFQDRNVVDGSRNMSGVFCDGLIWDRVLTAQEKIDLVDYFKSARGYKRYKPTPNNIFILGDSNATGGYSGSTKAANTTQVLKNNLGANWNVSDFAIAGLSTPNAILQFNNVIVNQFITGFTKNIFIPISCANHLASGDAVTAAIALQSYTDLCDAARASGFTVLGITTYHRSGGISGTPAIFEANRVSVNASILTYHASNGELVADLAADPRLDDANDLTYFGVDGVHINAAGHAAVAELLEDKIILL